MAHALHLASVDGVCSGHGPNGTASCRKNSIVANRSLECAAHSKLHAKHTVHNAQLTLLWQIEQHSAADVAAAGRTGRMSPPSKSTPISCGEHAGRAVAIVGCKRAQIQPHTTLTATSR
jgi:hypothetical protein